MCTCASGLQVHWLQGQTGQTGSLTCHVWGDVLMCCLFFTGWHVDPGGKDRPLCPCCSCLCWVLMWRALLWGLHSIWGPCQQHKGSM